MSYPDTLKQTWQSHIAPRDPDAPTVISTFAGCGGSSLGYSMAGFRELLAVECDDNAVETFHRNFNGVPVARDITKLTPEEAMELADINPGELDVLDGSPPCQGFSTAGKRTFNDPRNSLFKDYVKLLDGLQPKAFVMENVRGMVSGKMKLVFAQCMRELKACGYTVSARILNAKYYGVPQARERLIFIGVREDLHTTPSHPAPFSRVITASEAISDIVNDPAELEMLLGAGRKYAAYKEWHLLKPGQSLSDIRADGSCFSGRKLHPNKPANTLTKTQGTITMHGALHWAERRRFTIAESKRLGSFPDEFQFVGTYKNALERIGNSVPPLLMRSIATHIRQNLLDVKVGQEAA